MANRSLDNLPTNRGPGVKDSVGDDAPEEEPLPWDGVDNVLLWFKPVESPWVSAVTSMDVVVASLISSSTGATDSMTTAGVTTGATGGGEGVLLTVLFGTQ